MANHNRLTKEFEDIEVTKLFRDFDHGNVSHALSPAFTRPVYAYTKASVGGYKGNVQNV